MRGMIAEGKRVLAVEGFFFFFFGGKGGGDCCTLFLTQVFLSESFFFLREP